MLYRLAASAAFAMLCLSACGRGPETSAADAAETTEAAPPAAETPPSPAPGEAAPPADAPAAPIVAGAPPFAALYPGAELDGPPTTAHGEAGAGGLAIFRTDAAPEAVIAFYRERAEAAGLASVTGMNQGDARAYGARADGDQGASLQVVAAPTEEGDTSVQLSWSEGE